MRDSYEMKIDKLVNETFDLLPGLIKEVLKLKRKLEKVLILNYYALFEMNYI
jgi:hypothetical protein